MSLRHQARGEELAMDIELSEFRIDRLGPVDLRRRPTEIKPLYRSNSDYRSLLENQVDTLSALQERLYASGRQSMLLIFQAMDAAGKDGAIKHVMSGVNPQGCQVFSFKHPGPEDLSHDFLWRYVQRLPEKGRIGIFNRSYYEEVLIVRVHPDLLTSEEKVDFAGTADRVWASRYKSIRNLEEHLHANGTCLIKIFLHLSKDEQKRRFLSRIEKRDKNWKFSLSDMEERRFWDDYRSAYELALGETSTADSPWYAVPADDKANARLIISKIILDRLKDLHLEVPAASQEDHRRLKAFKSELESE